MGRSKRRRKKTNVKNIKATPKKNLPVKKPSPEDKRWTYGGIALPAIISGLFLILSLFIIKSQNEVLNPISESCKIQIQLEQTIEKLKSELTQEDLNRDQKLILNTYLSTFQDYHQLQDLCNPSFKKVGKINEEINYINKKIPELKLSL